MAKICAYLVCWRRSTKGEIGDDGLDETFESGRKSCRDRNPDRRVRAGVEQGFAGASAGPIGAWHLAFDHQPQQPQFHDNEHVWP